MEETPHAERTIIRRGTRTRGQSENTSENVGGECESREPSCRCIGRLHGVSLFNSLADFLADNPISSGRPSGIQKGGGGFSCCHKFRRSSSFRDHWLIPHGNSIDLVYDTISRAPATQGLIKIRTKSALEIGHVFLAWSPSPKSVFRVGLREYSLTLVLAKT